MPQTFHQFGQLPWELREMIWTLVIRPARPGVHIFGIYSDDDGDLSDKYDIGYWRPPAYLTAPRCTPRPRGVLSKSKRRRLKEAATKSWTNHNPSTYLIDGGLWTACKESRLVIERAFQSREWDAVRWGDILFESPRKREYMTDKMLRTVEDPEFQLPPPTNSDDSDTNMPVTGYFTADDSTKRFFTVFPNRDLIYLQPHNAETIDWYWLDCIIPWGPDFGTSGVGDIALDFDSLSPVRGSALFEKFREAAFHDDADMPWRLFFIDSDYEITAMQSEQADKGARDVYYASDRRFVEVYEHEASMGITRCQRFVNEINEAIEWEKNDIEWKNIFLSPDQLEESEDPKVSVGILACEYL